MPEPSDTAAQEFDGLLALAAEQGASDLHLKGGRPPMLRFEGDLAPADRPAPDAAAVARMAEAVMGDADRRRLAARGQAEFSRALDDGNRFRVSVYRQRGRLSIAVRRVNREIPTFGDLHLPVETMEHLCEARQGLVIFTGVTGTGKSTSIAACLDRINARRRCHIVTIEDPIEYLLADREALVTQREIGTDVPSYEAAMESLLRADPDVVLVGEMRSAETVEGVLRAAETTRLVFTTTHAMSAPGAVRRVLDLFEERQRRLVRDTLAAGLVGVVCQRLVPAADPNVGRVPATEVLRATPAVRAAVRAGETDRLADLVSAGAADGMHDLTQDLARLVREEWVQPAAAYEVAPNPEALKVAIRGIQIRKGTMR
ncbi:MAG: PilT/PilU family type 4a pilus ATPase [Phycisphaerae bacterium]